MTSLPDYYATLEVNENASPEVITSAYRSLARKYHPDTNPSPEANARMKSINVAYDVLSDRNKRAEYDRKRAAAAKPAAPVSPPPPASQPKPPPPRPSTVAAKPTSSQTAPRTAPTAPPKSEAKAPAASAPPKIVPKTPASSVPPKTAPPRRAGSTFLASPAFTSFVLAFIIAFAVLTLLAEALLLFEYEWMIIPVSLAIAVATAIWQSRKR